MRIRCSPYRLHCVTFTRGRRGPCQSLRLFIVSLRLQLLSTEALTFGTCIDADIVCSRAKNHYDPQGTVDFSDSATQVDATQADTSLEAYRRGFKPLHKSQSTLMYFSARSILEFPFEPSTNSTSIVISPSYASLPLLHLIHVLVRQASPSISKDNWLTDRFTSQLHSSFVVIEVFHHFALVH